MLLCAVWAVFVIESFTTTTSVNMIINIVVQSSNIFVGRSIRAMLAVFIEQNGWGGEVEEGIMVEMGGTKLW